MYKLLKLINTVGVDAINHFLHKVLFLHSLKVFESSESKGTLELIILESGHMLVSQAQELLVSSRRDALRSQCKEKQATCSL